MITAITLTAPDTPDDFRVYRGVRRVIRRQLVTKPRHLHDARLDSLMRIGSRHAFFLDDDDELPDDYEDVLSECVRMMDKHGYGLVYTDEVLREADGKEWVRHALNPYDANLHRQRPTSVHHLVLMDVALAQRIAPRLPRGNYWTELMLYWAMAQRRGAACLPRVGYVWNAHSGKHLSQSPAFLHAQGDTRRWISEASR